MTAAWAVLNVLAHVVILLSYGLREHAWAPRLPVWRRYLSCLPWLMHFPTTWGPNRPWWFGLGLVLVAATVHHWNRDTANRGDDDKRGGKSPEARLTDVQGAAFQREAGAAA